MNFLTPGPLQIDPEWMTCALRRAGAIRGAKVVDMTCKPVGDGLVGDSYRFALAYEEVEPDAPASVIGSFRRPIRTAAVRVLHTCSIFARCRSIASSPTPSPSIRPAPSSPRSIRKPMTSS